MSLYLALATNLVGQNFTTVAIKFAIENYQYFLCLLICMALLELKTATLDFLKLMFHTRKRMLPKRTFNLTEIDNCSESVEFHICTMGTISSGESVEHKRRAVQWSSPRFFSYHRRSELQSLHQMRLLWQ